MASRYGWTLTKQRVVGALLMLPLVGVIAVLIGAGQSGGGMRNALGRLTSNLYTLWFVAGLLGLAAGIRLVARSFPRR
jgi:uncharacterized membrane protein